MNGKDFYKILGVSRTASADEIKRAHRKLARKHHPDLNPGDKKAEEAFKAIQEAYDVLSDPEKRATFDQVGDAHNQAPFGGGRPNDTTTAGAGFPFGGGDTSASFNLNDIMNDLFGGRRGANPGFGGYGAQPKEDVEYNFEVSLEEAYRGVSKPLSVDVEDVCPMCNGVGQKRNRAGQFDLKSGPCPRCRGRGVVQGHRDTSISIPAGSWDGIRLKVRGQGPVGADMQKSDLVVIIKVRAHDQFDREGQNLLFDVSVPFTVAALGGEVTVQMLGGRQRQLMIPEGIQSGQKLRLSGQGMPSIHDRPGGDAFARVKIVIPRDLTAQERGLLNELAKLRHDSVKTVG